MRAEKDFLEQKYLEKRLCETPPPRKSNRYEERKLGRRKLYFNGQDLDFVHAPYHVNYITMSSVVSPVSCSLGPRGATYDLKPDPKAYLLFKGAAMVLFIGRYLSSTLNEFFLLLHSLIKEEYEHERVNICRMIRSAIQPNCWYRSWYSYRLSIIKCLKGPPKHNVFHWVKIHHLINCRSFKFLIWRQLVLLNNNTYVLPDKPTTIFLLYILSLRWECSCPSTDT